MDFLHLGRAEISLADRVLNIGLYFFPLNGREKGGSTVRRLINAEPKSLPNSDQEEKEYVPVEDWEGTVKLAATVTVPPLLRE
jgi:hypothetical protein